MLDVEAVVGKFRRLLRGVSTGAPFPLEAFSSRALCFSAVQQLCSLGHCEGESKGGGGVGQMTDVEAQISADEALARRIQVGIRLFVLTL